MMTSLALYNLIRSAILKKDLTFDDSIDAGTRRSITGSTIWYWNYFLKKEQSVASLPRSFVKTVELTRHIFLV